MTANDERREQLEAGQCTDCTNPHLPGLTLCGPCAYWHGFTPYHVERLSIEEIAAKYPSARARVDAGIEHACQVLEAVCTVCRSPLTPGDRDICWACARDQALATGDVEDYGR